MSLKLLQPGTQPLGQYDGYDSEFLTLKGGEIVTFTSIVVNGDKAARDIYDGYVNPSGVQKRVVVTRNVVAGSRPLMLTDDGVTGYGTLFGSVVGGTVGQQATGAILGPHTATGSGKVTLWEKPGIYGVSLDACDTAAVDGLQPTNVTLNTGAALTYSVNASSILSGFLTPVGSTAAAGNTTVVARFIDFETNGSLVTTPNNLVGALNPPDGVLSTGGAKQYAYATFYFNPPMI